MKNRFALVCSKSAFQEWFQGWSVPASLLSFNPPPPNVPPTSFNDSEMTPASSWLKQNCLPAALGCCGVQRIGHWEWWKAIDMKKIQGYFEVSRANFKLIHAFYSRFVFGTVLSSMPELLSWLSADWPFTSCVGRCFSVLFSTTQSLTVSLLILKPTQMKMLACLIQNYSQTCIMRLRKSRICFPVIFTSVKRSPLWSGRNHLWVSLNGLFVLSSTCIERSLKAELLE